MEWLFRKSDEEKSSKEPRTNKVKQVQSVSCWSKKL